MTISSGFFNSVSGDRKYNAKHFNEIFDGMLKDGIYTTIGDQFNVTAGTGLQVIVGTGRGWFKNTWIYNDAPIPISITSADPAYKRIDAIVIDINTGTTVRNNDIKYIIGTAASSPDKPTLANDPTHKQYPLAWVTVNPGVTEINSGNITDCKLTGEIPAVEAILEYSSNSKAQIDARFTRDEKPAFTESGTEDNIASGETIFVIFGKIQKFINIIKNKLPVKYGGTGKNTFTANAVLLGNATSAVKEKASNTGAFYSDGAGQEPKFGTLPVNRGGTGATTAAQALTNLGVPSDVSKAMSKDVYCSRDANRLIINPDNGGTGQTSLQATRNAMGLGNTTGALPLANGGTGAALSANPSMLTNLGSTGADAVFKASPRPGVTGILPYTNGGTSINSNPSMLINLGSASADTVFKAAPRPGVTGTLSIANGGTGKTTAAEARANLGVAYGTTAGTVCQGNDSRLSNKREPTSHAVDANTYGLGTVYVFGHVKLTDSYSNTSASSSIALSPKALYDAMGSIAAHFVSVNNEIDKCMKKSGGTFTSNVTIDQGGYSTDETWSRLYLGNPKSIGTAGNQTGVLSLYAANGKLVSLVPTASSAACTIRLPASAGTLALAGSSSRRVKENIKDMTEEKAKKILDVNVVDFDYIEGYFGGLKDQCGVIAEDTLDIIPEAVEIADGYDETKPIDEGSNPAPSVDYRKFVPYLIKMVQIQQKEIEELKARL